MVNAYWTLVAWPGMLVLSYIYIEKMEHGKKLVRAILIFGAVIVLVMRINFLFNIHPVPHFNNRNPKEMAKLISLKTDNEVVFVNTFIDAALYSFYSGKQSYAINNTQYKKTQYNYMFNAEERLQGKTVNLISFNKHLFNSDTINTPKGKTYYYNTIDNFISYQSSFKIKASPPKELNAGEKLFLPIELEKSAEGENTKNPEDVYLIFTFYDKQNAQAFSSYRYYEKFPDVLEPFEIIAPEKAGKYKTHFSISPDTSMVFRTYNSKVWFLEIVSY
jgi:hypothetical protein